MVAKFNSMTHLQNTFFVFWSRFVRVWLQSLQKVLIIICKNAKTSFPSENYIAKDEKAQCKYRNIIPANLMPEKSSGPWKETFYIASCGKSLPIPWRGLFKFPHARISLSVPGRGPFTFPYAGKVFWTLAEVLFHIPSCPEKSSGPCKGIFTISPCRKSLLDPGRRPFLHSLMPGKVFRSLEGDLLHPPMPEKSL
jgi:hypothetical protein